MHTTTKVEEDVGEPAPKKRHVEGKMDGFVAKGRAQEQFCKDVVRAFASSNIPLSKLAPGSPMRQLFEKYMKVDGESPSLALVDPNNLRKTWVSKVHEEGVSLRGFFFTFPCLFPEVKKLKRIIEDGSWFVCLSADETDDPRSCNEYIVTVDCTLIPRIASAEADTNVKPYHLEMKFPKAMNTKTCGVPKVVVTHKSGKNLTTCPPPLVA